MASTEELTTIQEPVEGDAPLPTQEVIGDTLEPKSEPESAKEKPMGSPEQKGTPSKRALTGSAPKRPAAPATTRTSKPTAPSTRTAPGSTLNKPPIRPTNVSSTRRPPSSGAPPTTATHRSRVSIGSSADERTSRVTSSGDETRRTGATAKRMSLSGVPATRAPARSTAISDRKAAVTPSTRTGTTRTAPSTTQSPSKSTPRSTTTAPPASARTTRPITTGRTSVSSADAVKRRSGVPGSPVTKRSSVDTSTRQLTSKYPELQKRITEHEAIRAMLLAAIAADEAGDSAKRDEFQADIDREVSKLKGNMDVDKHANTEGLEDDKASQLQAQLEASEKRISELQELLDESLTKNAEMEKNSVAHAEHSAQAASLAETHSQELDILQNRLKEAETKYEGLMAHSSKELEEAKQSAAEFGESKAAELLEEQKAVHIATLEKLEAELAAERSSAAELSTQIEALRADISAKMEELEAAKKLVESEKQAAIEAHQEKLAQLEGELRGQDTVMKSLKDEVQLLKDKKDRELVEAQESTSQTVAALEEKIASLQEKLAQTESENSSNSELLGNKESEIERLNEVINELQEKIQKIHESHSDAEQEKITELNMAHERMIAAMKAEHDSALANLAAKDGLKYVELAKEGQEMKLTLEEKIATLTEDHQATQAQLASTTAELEAIKTLSAQEMIELKSAHGDELQSLQTKLSEAEQALHDVKKLTEESNAAEKEVTANIILSLEEKLKAMEAEIIDSNTRVQSLIADLDAERAQAEALQKGLEELKGHSKDKEESQESLINKLTTETEAVTKSLEEKANELSAAEEKHTAALNDLSATHQAALEALKTEVSQAHQSALEEIQQKLDDVSSNKVELETTYATQLEALKSEHALAIEEHEAKLAALEDSHKAAIENLKQEFEESRAQHGQEVEATQRKKLDELEATHAKAIEELLGAHEEKLNNLRADLERAAEGNIAAVKDSHAADLTALQQELTKAQQAAADTTAVDKLHEELAEVSSQLANAKQEKANLESALQLSQAELSELENMRTELESTKQQLSSTNEKLTKLQQTHEGVAAELEKLKVTAAVAEEKAQEAEAKLLDLEKSIGALSEKNISLIEQLQEAEATAAKANRRIRELEFDLAEATKGKDEPTPVSNGNHPNSKGGLSESKWAVRDDDEAANDGKNDLFSHHVGADGDPVSAEDKNLGSVIQGTMGSMKERLEQLHDDNEALLDDYARIVDSLSKADQLLSPPHSPETLDTFGPGGRAASSN